MQAGSATYFGFATRCLSLWTSHFPGSTPAPPLQRVLPWRMPGENSHSLLLDFFFSFLSFGMFCSPLSSFIPRSPLDVSLAPWRPGDPFSLPPALPLSSFDFALEVLGVFSGEIALAPATSCFFFFFLFFGVPASSWSPDSFRFWPFFPLSLMASVAFCLSCSSSSVRTFITEACTCASLRGQGCSRRRWVMLFGRVCAGAVELKVFFLGFLGFSGVGPEEAFFLPVDHRSWRLQVWKAEGQILHNV